MNMPFERRMDGNCSCRDSGPPEETLLVDSFVVLCPPLGARDLAGAIKRAADHIGKPYDSTFDFRMAERMVCTEVINRGLHGGGEVRFHLKEVGGRLCLPAEEFLDRAIAWFPSCCPRWSPRRFPPNGRSRRDGVLGEPAKGRGRRHDQMMNFSGKELAEVPGAI